MSENTFQLELDLGSSAKDAKEVARWIDEMSDSAEDAAKGLSKLETAGDGLGKGLDKVEEANKKATKSTNDLGQSVLKASHGFQDFVQGGLSGLLNNIPEIVDSVGGSAGLAGALSVVAVAAYIAIPAFTDLYKAIVDGSNDIPKSTDRLKGLNDELKTNKDRLEELGKQTTLTNTELGEYNSLTTKTVDLEKQVNAEKERRNTLDKLRQKEQAGDAESAAIATAAITEQGGVDKTVTDVHRRLQAESPEVKKLRKKVDDLEELSNRRKSEDPNNLSGEGFYDLDVKLARQNLGRAEQGVQGKASDLVANASKGDQAAIAELVRLLPNSSFGQATPEAIRAQNAHVDDVIEEGDNAHNASASRRAARNKAARAAADDEKLVNSLNEEGAANEKATFEPARKAADQARAVFDRETDAALKAGEKDLAPDPKQDAKLADIRERAGLGIDFKQTMNARGFSPIPVDVAEAAKSMQADMGQGIGEDQAIANAFNKLMTKLNKVIEINNRNAMMFNGFNNQVDSLPPVIDPF